MNKEKYLYSVILIIIILVINYNFSPANFKPGECITSKEDGYIWYIADYSKREYTVLGWQEVGWGNPVNTDRNILERSTNDKEFSLYYLSKCPQYGNVKYTIIENVTN